VSATNKTENMKEKKRERKGKRIHTEIFLNHLQIFHVVVTIYNSILLTSLAPRSGLRSSYINQHRAQLQSQGSRERLAMMLASSTKSEREGDNQVNQEERRKTNQKMKENKRKQVR
jgi:hypothetical protein